ncbi:hypothetical protein L249_6475, partial [Ophiocordyceps polyrhachis-furcata BCC 54312]
MKTKTSQAETDSADGDLLDIFSPDPSLQLTARLDGLAVRYGPSTSRGERGGGQADLFLASSTVRREFSLSPSLILSVAAFGSPSIRGRPAQQTPFFGADGRLERRRRWYAANERQKSRRRATEACFQSGQGRPETGKSHCYTDGASLRRDRQGLCDAPQLRL